MAGWWDGGTTGDWGSLTPCTSTQRWSASRLPPEYSAMMWDAPRFT